MTIATAPGTVVARRQPADSAALRTWPAPDRRRLLQLLLAATWLLDAVLQLQPFMFTRSFGSAMLSSVAIGNPAFVAHPITWAAREIASHSTGANGAFFAVQLMLALGIAFRPLARVALVASVGWSLGVWWIGEGLGGVLTGHLSPLSGAPGPAVLYALAAVLLWPSNRPATRPARSVAERPFGAVPARLLWLTLWVSLAYFALLPQNSSPNGPSRAIAQLAVGQPGWLRGIDLRTASALAGRGVAVSVAFAVLAGLVGIGVLLPARLAKLAVLMAAVIALTIWVIGQAFGGIFGSAATDPGSGPILLLLAGAFWPQREVAGRRPQHG